MTLIGKYSITLPNDANNVVLPHLIRKSEYIVTVRGFTQYGEGRILEYNFTTLGNVLCHFFLYIITVISLQLYSVNSYELKYNNIAETFCPPCFSKVSLYDKIPNLSILRYLRRYIKKMEIPFLLCNFLEILKRNNDIELPSKFFLPRKL